MNVMTSANWYFDYVSPFPYLQLMRFGELPADLEIRPKPILLAALLNHWGHKGPAEIPAKRRQTYYYASWQAARRGVDFAWPPRHPFNSLALLRLTIVAGGSLDVIKTTYRHVFGTGHDGQDTASINQLAEQLGVADWQSRVADPAVKAAVRANTDEAIERGVYGVPTISVAEQLFWGDDMLPMLLDFLRDPMLFDRAPYSALDSIPPAAERRSRP
ncbi:MAG: 2-hydroxychromene-2-carboxylate isomerase [Pseudomonadota bacterium]